jgi:hypothetical protein
VPYQASGICGAILGKARVFLHIYLLIRDLSILGEAVVSPAVLRLVEVSERNPPELVSHDAFGQRIHALGTSGGRWKLLELGTREGCVAEGYDGNLGRIGQFAR